MIQINTYRAANHGFVTEACGWGKSFRKDANSTTSIDNWQLWAEAKIVREKLEGFIANRTIAYRKASAMTKDVADTIKLLRYFMISTQGKGAMALYKMVVAHECKFRMLMPAKECEMNVYVPEIIAFCKLKTKS